MTKLISPNFPLERKQSYYGFRWESKYSLKDTSLASRRLVQQTSPTHAHREKGSLVIATTAARKGWSPLLLP